MQVVGLAFRSGFCLVSAPDDLCHAGSAFCSSPSLGVAFLIPEWGGSSELGDPRDLFPF